MRVGGMVGNIKLLQIQKSQNPDLKKEKKKLSHLKPLQKDYFCLFERQIAFTSTRFILFQEYKKGFRK